MTLVIRLVAFALSACAGGTAAARRSPWPRPFELALILAFELLEPQFIPLA